MRDDIPQFSYFCKPITNVVPLYAVCIPGIYLYIVGEYARKQTEELRSISDIKERKAYKASNFDYCCFSGLFRTRNEAGLIGHSGLICIDFDHVADIPRLRSQLLNHPYFDTELLFVSPSGDGMKWVIAVELGKYTHKQMFTAVVNCLRATGLPDVDMSGSDVARACFLPHDPEAYINPKYQDYVENPIYPTRVDECPF